jgi:hypothetical protein
VRIWVPCSVKMRLAVVVAMAAASTGGEVFTGGLLGVRATVHRHNATHADLALRAGGVPLASGTAEFSPTTGEVRLSPEIADALRRRGVALTEVRPSADHIDVAARVPLVGRLRLRLHKKKG